MRPRILHVIDHTGSGGAQVVIRYLMRALAKDFDFSVAVLGRTGSFSEDYRALGVPVFELGQGHGRWSPLPLIGLLRILRQEQCELVHTHLFKSNVLGAIAASWTGRKVIIHDHSDTHAQALRQQFHFSNGFSRSLYLSGYRYALNRCHQAIVLTPETLCAYKQAYRLEPAAIKVLPNAVDVREFNPAGKDVVAGSLQKELGLPCQTKLVMMIGRLEPQKDWWTFLQVARKVQETYDSNCAFVAVGSGSQQAELRDYVRRTSLDRVFVLGYRQDVPALLHQADVFLLTSRREPFGIVILEAMAVGCPVVATRSGGPNSILTDGVDGLLVAVGDVQGLSGQILNLLRNEELAQRLARNARETVASQYSVEAVAAQMASIYQGVLDL